MTKTERGDLVATTIWNWLQQQKAVEFVPWVTDPKNPDYDPLKVARQAERTELLEDLERTILAVSGANRDS